MDVRAILGERVMSVCVVRYRAVSENLQGAQVWYNKSMPPANCAVLHQVTLRSDKVSAGGQLVRLGETVGDELMGWQWIDALEVVEVLGALGEDGKTVTPLPIEPVPFGQVA